MKSISARACVVLGVCLACASAVTFAADLPNAAMSSRTIVGLSADHNPCTDFFQYVNGNWLATAQIPADRARWGAFDELDKRTKEVLRQILDSTVRSDPSAAGSAQRKVIDFYRSGMDTSAIERAGLQPLRAKLDRIDAIGSRRDLADVIADLQRLDINPGFDLSITTDARDSTRYLIEFEQAGLGLPERDYYFRTDAKSAAQRAEYVKHIARMFELMGDTPERAANNANTVMALETRFAQASMTRVERRDPTAITNKTLASELPRVAPGVEWDRYLQALGVAQAKEINVAQPGFLKAFAAAVASVPIDDWKTYLRWQLIHATASKLSAAFETENFNFYGIYLTGRKEMQPRAERVVGVITGRFGNAPLAMAAGELYVVKQFPPEAKARALVLVDNVKTALREQIRTLDWMSEPTRQAALKKLDAMETKIGYPDHWRDYSALNIDATSYVGNWLAGNAFETQREISLVAKPVDRSDWFVSPHVVNAFYSPRRNAIVFPAGILQPPFFDPERDDAMNYGGIGMVIGHEITHGFDDTGRQFDAAGNLQDWWSKEDAVRYTSRADVVTRQYADYLGIDGLNVNGKLTLGENIADIGGIKIAYQALQRALKEHPQPLIDGMTPDQRFFISFAQIWRLKQTPETERLQITTDTHSPARFRVQGAVANMPEFAQTFSCKISDKAVRAGDDRVSIW